MAEVNVLDVPMVRRSPVFRNVMTRLLGDGQSVRFRAHGGSMYPTISDGELVTVAPAAPPHLTPGDIILFETSSGVIMHRIVSMTGAGPDLRYVCCGDASVMDDAPITAEAVLGRVVEIEQGGRRRRPGHRTWPWRALRPLRRAVRSGRRLRSAVGLKASAEAWPTREDRFLAGLLRDKEWPDMPATGAAEEQFLESSRRHRIQPLLAHALRARELHARWPDRVRRQLDRAATAAAAVAELQRQATDQVLDALATAGVRPIVFKGGHLAYSHYPDAGLRPRADTDLLVRHAEMPAARAALASLRYRPALHTTGTAVTHQHPYGRMDRFGVHHVYDLHWKIAEPHLFADLLTFDEIDAEAVDLVGFGAPARVPSDVHALVIASVHRVAHHNDSPRLLWLYDVHRLVERMAPDQAPRFAQFAVDRRIAAVCADALTKAQAIFGTALPAGLMPEIASQPAEASAAFLGGRLRRVDQLRSDLTTLRGWAARGRLLREHLLPSGDYMRRRYSLRSSALLPLAYVCRIARGACHWVRPLES